MRTDSVVEGFLQIGEPIGLRPGAGGVHQLAFEAAQNADGCFCLFPFQFTSEYKDYSIELKYMIPLNDYTWAQISQFSSDGKASSMFSVGDEKEVVINGTIGDTVFSNVTMMSAFILGFNHYSTVEGKNLMLKGLIHLMFFLNVGIMDLRENILYY